MAHESVTPRRTGPPVWWSLGLAGLTTLGLGVLTWGLLMVHALAYSIFAVIGPKPGIAAPHVNRYLLALGVGAVVNLAGAPILTCVALRTRARSWAPAVLGLSAALTSAMAAACTLLLLLGINPAEFVLNL